MNELTYEIAEKIFGWRWFCSDEAGYSILVHPDNVWCYMPDNDMMPGWVAGKSHDASPYINCPDYAGSYEGMQDVIKWLTSRAGHLSVYSIGQNSALYGWRAYCLHLSATGETMPEAVARVALEYCDYLGGENETVA